MNKYLAMIAVNFFVKLKGGLSNFYIKIVSACHLKIMQNIYIPWYSFILFEKRNSNNLDIAGWCNG